MIGEAGLKSEKALDCLHTLYFDMVRKAYYYHRLEKTQILDAYSNALLALKSNILAGKYQRRGSLRAFFAMTFRNKCIDVIRDNPTNQLNPEFENFLRNEMKESPVNPEEELTNEETRNEDERKAELRKKCLEEAMEVLVAEEKDLLDDYYVRRLKAEEAAKKYGYKNAHTVRQTVVNLKTKVRESIRALCETKPQCRILCP